MGYPVAIPVEQQGVPAGRSRGLEKTLRSLRPPPVGRFGIDVGEEALLVRLQLVPECFGFLLHELYADDRFDPLETVFPRHDQTDGSTVYVWQFMAVNRGSQQRQLVGGLVDGKSFGVSPELLWPVPLTLGLMGSQERGHLDVAC